MDNKSILLKCMCGCGIINIEKIDDETEISYGISYLKDSFYSEQLSVFDLIKKRIKNAWLTLIGKEYLLFDVVITQSEFEIFKQKISNW